MKNDHGAPGPAGLTQAVAAAEQDADRRTSRPDEPGSQKKMTRRRWIVITAAGVSAFAALLAAVSGVAFGVFGITRDRAATPAASPARPGHSAEPVPARTGAAPMTTPTAFPGTSNPALATPPGTAPSGPLAPPITQGPPGPAPAGSRVISAGGHRAGGPATQPIGPTRRAAKATTLAVSLHATPADGGTLYGRYVDISGSISGPHPSGQLWLVWAGLPKPTDPKQVEEFYSKGEIRPASDASFSFPNLTMGDTSSWSVHRTWRVFVAVATTEAAQQWLQDNLANNTNKAWDANRLALPAGVHQIGQPIFVTRSI